MQGFLIGFTALLAGGGLAAATTFGLVETATSGQSTPENSTSVLEYGQTSQ